MNLAIFIMSTVYGHIQSNIVKLLMFEIYYVADCVILISLPFDGNDQLIHHYCSY